AFSSNVICTVEPSGKQCAAVTNTIGERRNPEQSSVPPPWSWSAAPTYGCAPLSGEPPMIASAEPPSASATAVTRPAESVRVARSVLPAPSRKTPSPRLRLSAAGPSCSSDRLSATPTGGKMQANHPSNEGFSPWLLPLTALVSPFPDRP